MDIFAANRLAIELMTKHGLISKGWGFQMDNAVKRFGVCMYGRRVISMSKTLIQINDEARVRQTILHEIAHALTEGDGHGSKWKAKCIEIGCIPRRCYNSENTVIPKLRYVAVCGGCNKQWQRAKRVDSFIKRSCTCQTGINWDKRILLNYVDTKINLVV